MRVRRTLIVDDLPLLWIQALGGSTWMRSGAASINVSLHAIQ